MAAWSGLLILFLIAKAFSSKRVRDESMEDVEGMEGELCILTGSSLVPNGCEGLKFSSSKGAHQESILPSGEIKAKCDEICTYVFKLVETFISNGNLNQGIILEELEALGAAFVIKRPTFLKWIAMTAGLKSEDFAVLCARFTETMRLEHQSAYEESTRRSREFEACLKQTALSKEYYNSQIAKMCHTIDLLEEPSLDTTTTSNRGSRWAVEGAKGWLMAKRAEVDRVVSDMRSLVAKYKERCALENKLAGEKIGALERNLKENLPKGFRDIHSTIQEDFRSAVNSCREAIQTYKNFKISPHSAWFNANITEMSKLFSTKSLTVQKFKLPSSAPQKFVVVAGTPVFALAQSIFPFLKRASYRNDQLSRLYRYLLSFPSNQRFRKLKELGKSLYENALERHRALEGVIKFTRDRVSSELVDFFLVKKASNQSSEEPGCSGILKFDPDISELVRGIQNRLKELDAELRRVRSDGLYTSSCNLILSLCREEKFSEKLAQANKKLAKALMEVQENGYDVLYQQVYQNSG